MSGLLHLLLRERRTDHALGHLLLRHAWHLLLARHSLSVVLLLRVAASSHGSTSLIWVLTSAGSTSALTASAALSASSELSWELHVWHELSELIGDLRCVRIKLNVVNSLLDIIVYLVNLSSFSLLLLLLDFFLGQPQLNPHGSATVDVGVVELSDSVLCLLDLVVEDVGELAGDVVATLHLLEVDRDDGTSLAESLVELLLGQSGG